MSDQPTGYRPTPSDLKATELVAHGDMRIEVVKREINQGALGGMRSEITDHAAALVVVALDSYDDHITARAQELTRQLDNALFRIRWIRDRLRDFAGDHQYVRGADLRALVKLIEGDSQ